MTRALMLLLYADSSARFYQSVESGPGERLHLPVAGLSLWLRASGPYSRATRKAAAMTGYSVAVGERRGSARSRPPKLAIPSRPRLECTPPAFKTPCAIRETSSASGDLRALLLRGRAPPRGPRDRPGPGHRVRSLP